MGDRGGKDTAGSLPSKRRRINVIMDSDDEEAAESFDVATSVLEEASEEPAYVIKVATAENQQVATSTVSVYVMDNSNALTPFPTASILDRLTVPTVLIQIMIGNINFGQARESKIELPECLRLRYAFQVVITPKTHAVISKICSLTVDVCNQAELYFDGADRRFEQVFNLMDQSLPNQHANMNGKICTSPDPNEDRDANYETGTALDRHGETDLGVALERLLRSGSMFPGSKRPPVMALDSKNMSRSLVGGDSTIHKRPELDVNFLWLMDFGVSSYESWLRREQNKLKRVILTLEAFVSSHGFEPHQVTAVTKRRIRRSYRDFEINELGAYKTDELPNTPKNDFVTIVCASEYSKWYSEQLLGFIYTAIDWTLQRYDFAAMLDNINASSTVRMEIWTKMTENVTWFHDAGKEVETVVGE